MRIFVNKVFVRHVKFYGLNGDYIKQVLEEIKQGRSIPLGSKIYKVRASRPGSGKSSGFRNIFYWDKDRLIIVCMLYSRSRQGNISHAELSALRMLSEEYDELSEQEIQQRVYNQTLVEIFYENKR